MCALLINNKYLCMCVCVANAVLVYTVYKYVDFNHDLFWNCMVNGYDD